jgi:glycosyltransferase involved in cell wall biosynthesis
MKPQISVLLPTFNSAGVVRPLLESIIWADELLVVDSYSTDSTLEICREYGARILQHEYINSAKQKNWAAPQAINEWVLQIDTDETLEPGLREEICAALQQVPADVDAFRLPRKNYVLGRWARHGGLYPDPQIRLFRRDRGRWIEREVHAHVQVPGKIENLQGHILHQGMPSITNQLRNLDRYTRYEADELKKQGRRFHWSKLLVHPWLVFLHRYLWLQGWRDGWRGLVLCTYLGVYSFFMYAKLWELEELGLEKSPR